MAASGSTASAALAGKRAFAAFSLGGREHIFGPGAVHGELTQGMMRNFLQGTLGYVGLQVHGPFIAYHVPYVTAERRAQMLGKVRAYVHALDAQPCMPVPELSRFDEVLQPR
jgi:NAD(P)H dehydrogenase (quinone)